MLSNPTGGVPEYNPDGGPSVSYQGDCFPDVRFTIQKDYLDRGGVIPAHANNLFSCVLNVQPAAASTTAIAAAAAAASGTAQTLATTVGATPGIGTAVPFVTSSGTLATGTMIEPGFTTGTTTASSTTIASVPVLGLTQMWVGQSIYIANVGNSGGTTGLFTRVTAITFTSGSTGSITVADAPAASLTAARICQTNLFTNNWGGTATAVTPFLSIPQGGPAAPYDPSAACTRVVSITGNASSTGGAFTVRGYDLYGFAMTETITHAGGATTKYGRKGFKVVSSVTPGFTDAGHTYSVGFGDEVGLALRSDLFEFISIYYNQAYITATTGWTAADLTATATGTTTDVRGSLAIGSLNNAGTGIAGGAFNASRRLTVFLTMPIGNVIAGLPTAPQAMYGVTQYSA